MHDLTSFTAFFCPLLILLNTLLLLVQTLCLEATAPLLSNPNFGKVSLAFSVWQVCSPACTCAHSVFLVKEVWGMEDQSAKLTSCNKDLNKTRLEVRVGMNTIMCTFLHISIQNLIKQLLLDSRWQVLYICKDMQDINFSCLLKPSGAQHWGQQKGYSNDTQRGCSVAMPFTGWHFVNGTQ